MGKEWVGKMLDFEEMRRIYRLEKSTSRLVEVPDDFFAQLNVLVEEERKKYFDSLKDLNASRARDFGNLKKLVDEWFVVREKKLLNSALVSAQLEETDTAHMAAEEKKVFSSLYDVLRAHRRLTKSVLDANGGFVSMVSPPLEIKKEKMEENEKEAVQDGSTEPLTHSTQPLADFWPVRILSEIPSFVGTDLKEYGPYKTGQVVDLPSKIAQLFVSRKLGEKVA
jgi:DNA replication initiation complex subunit (GINS family)